MTQIGVIAGTPVDTQMGIDFLRSRGVEATGIPTAQSSQEQPMLQFMSPGELTQKVSKIICRFNKMDVSKIMIYCNSLSSAINIKKIKYLYPQMQIITPLDVYKKIGKLFDRIAIIAANGQSLSGIEKVFYSINNKLQILGCSMLPVIFAIEEKQQPQEIFNNFGLKYFVKTAEQFNVQTIILGCTHLPYIKEQLQAFTNISITDPSEEMFNMLLTPHEIPT